jgi:predicted nucleotidyltransferase
MIKTIPNQRLSVLLNDLQVSLVGIYGARLFSVILFGSQSRGGATPDSDFDLAS